MLELYNLGIEEKDLLEMIKICSEIKELDDEEIISKINILKTINCSDKQIRNILISNPSYLDRLDDDILKLIKKLLNLGFENLDLLFDSNPHVLNKDDFEIGEYIRENQEKGKSLEDIIDDLDSNPYIFDEM